jgi:hypothetical protein
LHRFGRWRGKKYFYWLSCTHVIQNIPTILPSTSSNLDTRETTIVAGVGRIFTTDNRYVKQDKPNLPEQVRNLEGKRRSSCEEIREEHTREIGTHIDTQKGRIWHKAPLQVYKEPPPIYVPKARQPLSVLFISLCKLTAPSVTIPTITDVRQAVNINQ